MGVHTRVGKRGAVVIPVAIRRRLHLEEGTIVTIDEREEGVLLKPVAAGPTAAERHRFFEQLTAQVAATRADAQAWAEEVAERAELAGTLLDGLRDPADTYRG